MSGFLCASGGSVEPLRERSTLYLDNKHYIELIRTRSGHQSIISALSRLEGNKSVIGLGFFGGIAPAVNVGDLLVPIKAEPLQAVPLTAGFPDRRLAASLARKSRELGPTHIGRVATSAVVKTESTQDIEDLWKQGVLGIDMESSCFFSTLNHRSTVCGALLICSDHIVKKPLPGIPVNEPRNLPLDPEVATIAKRAVFLAIETLCESS